MEIKKIIKKIDNNEEITFSQLCRLLKSDKRIDAYHQKTFFDDNGKAYCSKWAITFKPPYCGLMPCSNTAYVAEDY